MQQFPIVYGIASCDSVRKARAWLLEQGREYVWHDFKKQGADIALLQHWAAAVGWEVLLNRRGTTWRKLDAATQATVQDAASAIQLMQQHTSLIKRPVIDWGQNRITVGFQPQQWTH